MIEEEHRDTDGLCTEESSLALALEEVIRGYGSVLRHVLARLEGEERLTVPQFRCLQALAVTGSALTTQLARQMEVAVPTVTGRIDGLVARGFVERRPDPQDRRQIRLVLTEAGRGHFERCHHAIVNELQRLLAPLRPRQQSRLAAALQDLDLLLDPGRGDQAPDDAPDTGYSSSNG